MATINVTRGNATGSNENDIFNLTAQAGKGQIHSYDPGGDDLINLGFNGIDRFSHGQHARGGHGYDIFNFVDLDQVTDTVVGRIEDFDPTRDQIRIDGVSLDFNALPTNVRLVDYNGAMDDVSSYGQTWLLIDTGLGNIFYSLEGARIDMTGNGGANSGTQEAHFLLEDDLPDFATLADTTTIDQNFVPAGATAVGGLTINDVDVNAADVLELIAGSSSGDLIAAGINDDIVNGLGGDDVIWGGGGHDSLDGGAGNDTLYGGSGNETMKGGTGDDILSGDGGDDSILAGDGSDRLDGGAGSDFLSGGGNFDTLIGGLGNDSLDGGDGRDELNGGAGNDTLTGGSGLDVYAFEGSFGHDVVTDLSTGSVEQIDLRGLTNVYSTADINFEVVGGSTILTFDQDGDGVAETENSITLENVVLTPVDDQYYLFTPAGVAGGRFLGTTDDDILIGTAGNDTITGLDGNDDLLGGAGADSIDGGKGGDSIFGGTGNDTIDGGDNFDNIFGGDGNDVLSGGRGTDSINGGTGDDLLHGDGGNDQFIFGEDFGNDTISDFSMSVGEVIDLSDITGLIDVSDLTFIADSGSTIIRFDLDEDGVLDATNSITVTGLVLTGADADQFIF